MSLNRVVTTIRGCRAAIIDPRVVRRSVWEGAAQRVIPPYLKAKTARAVPEYRGARETPWESGRTIFQG